MLMGNTVLCDHRSLVRDGSAKVQDQHEIKLPKLFQFPKAI
jgi:hypothetical protein